MRLVGGEIRELDFVVTDGDVRIVGRENDGDIVHSFFRHIIQCK